MAAVTVPENQTFTFDSSSTIGDLLLVANALRNAGQQPKLRLVRSYNGQLKSVAVGVEGTAPSGEMAIGEGLSDAELVAKMVQHTARVCSLVTDAMLANVDVESTAPSREMAVTVGES